MPALLLAVAMIATTPKERLAALSREYGIYILAAETRHEEGREVKISCDPVDPGVLDRYVELFEREWRRYPKSLMPRIKVRKVIIGSDVKVLGHPRAAVPDFERGWYWLDAKVGQRVPRYGRHVLHHDLFHLIDEYDSPDGRADRSWEALNAPGRSYGKGGWFMQSGNVGALREDLPGFLTEYATSAVEEDKAEVFGHLITNPAFVRRRAAADPVMEAKVKRVKELVKAFEPLMDDAWWPR